MRRRLSEIFSRKKPVSAPKKPPFGWSGRYATWGEASALCAGYDADLILEKVLRAVRLVKDGQAAYERDSMTFEKVEYSWPLLSALLWVAGQNDQELNLIDFGGSLGSTYYQNRVFLKALKRVKWSIVEQPKFVKAGKTFLEDKELSFHGDIRACREETGANTLLVSSSLQYLEDPFGMIETFKSQSFDVIILDRTGFVEFPDHFITVQRVPPFIYDASYPCWVFNYSKFLDLFTDTYDVIAEFEAYVSTHYTADGLPAGDRGVILKRKAGR